MALSEREFFEENQQIFHDYYYIFVPSFLEEKSRRSGRAFEIGVLRNHNRHFAIWQNS